MPGEYHFKSYITYYYTLVCLRPEKERFHLQHRVAYEYIMIIDYRFCVRIAVILVIVKNSDMKYATEKII